MRFIIYCVSHNRLVTKGTIEERVMQLSAQKLELEKMIVQGKGPGKGARGGSGDANGAIEDRQGSVIDDTESLDSLLKYGATDLFKDSATAVKTTGGDGSDGDANKGGNEAEASKNAKGLAKGPQLQLEDEGNSEAAAAQLVLYDDAGFGELMDRSQIPGQQQKGTAADVDNQDDGNSIPSKAAAKGFSGGGGQTAASLMESFKDGRSVWKAREKERAEEKRQKEEAAAAAAQKAREEEEERLRIEAEMETVGQDEEFWKKLLEERVSAAQGVGQEELGRCAYCVCMDFVVLHIAVQCLTLAFACLHVGESANARRLKSLSR